MRIITLGKIKIHFFFFWLLFFTGLTASYAQCPTVADTTQSFCDLESPTIANLAAVSNGNGVVWYATATSTTPLSASLGLVDGEDYFADDNSGTCGTRQRVVVTIYRKPDGQSFQGPCVDSAGDATFADLVVTGNNIQWYTSPTGGTPLPINTTLTDNTIYYASQTNPDTGCETSRLSVFVNVGVVPVPTGNPNQQFCNIPGNPPTVASLVASGNNNWYLTSSSAVALDPATPLVNGQSYFATTVDPPCESTNRFEVVVTLVAPNNPGTNGTRQICANQVASTPPFNLFGQLGGTPDTTGTWSGPLATTNGHLGTVNVSSLTVGGSPYVFTYTVSSSLCPQSSATVTINILPVPTATVSTNTTICSGQSATVTFTGTPNATVNYTINGVAQTIVLNASGTATLTNTYTATTTIVLVSVTSAGTPSCSQSLTGTMVITVLPLPTVTIAANATICSGQSATVTFTGTPGATVNYTVNGVAQSIVLNGSGTATVTGTYTVTTTFSLVSIASAGTPSCTQPQTGTVVITVIQPPTVTISATPTTVCPNGSATVTFTGTPNATVNFTVNGTPQSIVLNASGTATITTTYAITTTYTLTSIATAGTPSCSQPATGSVTINVLPLPTVTISGTTTICPGQNATVTFTGTPGATVSYTVNGTPQTIVIGAGGTASITTSYTVTTTYTLVSIASAGTPSCTQPATGSVVITVSPPPTVAITANATICSGQSATVTFTGTPGATVNYTVNGTPQSIVLNASGTATITSTYTVTTTYTLVSASSSGTPSCTQPQTGSITITVIPPPTVTISADVTICSGQMATVTFTGTPNATVSFTVNGMPQTIVLNGSGTATLTGVYTVTTVYTLVGISTSGTPSCSQPVSGSITITVVQLPTVTIAADTSICIGQSATVTFTGTPNAIVSYTVNGVAQTIVLNAAGTATLTNTYTVTTVIQLVSVAISGTPGCSQPVTGTVTITVLPPPTATISANATICPGDSVTTTFTGTPGATVNYTVNGTPQSIVLDAGGTATLTNTYTVSTTIALVSATSAGTPNCTQPLTGQVLITIIPPPTVTVSASTTICSGQSATITFTGTPGATVNFTVNGVAQSIVLNASGNATITNTYTVTTVIQLVSASTSGTPSCSQPQLGSITITVVPPPTAAISGDATICPGDSATVTFTGTPGATVNFTVNGIPQSIVLDATGNASITTTYTVTTVYTLVSVTSAGTPSCTQPATGTVTITIIPPPTVSISAVPTTICPNGSSTVTFTGTPNATVNFTVNGTPQSIVLNAGGTATITSTYTITTTYTLVSISTAGTPSCSQPALGSVTITVLPLPVVTITANTSNVCAGTTATVTFSGTPNAIVSYTVNGVLHTITLNGSGLATVSTAFSVTTTYTLVSVASGGTPSCSQPATGTVTITAVQPPSAGNNAAVTLCASATPINLFSLLGTSAQPGGTWSPALASGTGFFNPAVDPSGTYTYTVPGTAPCPNATATVAVSVTPIPNAGNDASVNICSNASPQDLFAQLGASAQAGGTWSPALASGTGFFNPAVDLAGAYTYTVTGIAPCGNDTAVVTVQITPGPDAGQDGSLTLCTNSDPQDLFDALEGTPQVGGTWSPALASGTGVFDPAVDAPGVYTYTFLGSQPCDNDTATVTVTINPVPDAGDDGTAFFCTNHPPGDLFGSLGGTPQAGGTWSPALASGTGVFNPLVDAPGTYTYTVGGTFCATDTAEIVVTVIASPNAGGTGAPLLIDTCENVNSVDLFTALNGSQGVGTWNDDDASGALTDNIFNPQLAGPGTYHFTYTVGGGTAPCLFDTATVTVNVSPLPNAGEYIGLDEVCSAIGDFDLFSLLDGTQQSGGDWTDANGEVIPNLLNTLDYLPGTHTFTYTVTNTCGEDSEIVQLTILASPELLSSNVTVASPVCQNSVVTVNFADMADGNYTLNYSLSGSNVLASETVLLTITDGTGSFTIPAASVPNTGDTTITFHSILNNVNNCAATLTDVALTFTVNPVSNLETANVAAANVCLGTDVVVAISGATGLPDGDYQFNYTITDAVPGAGSTGTIAIAGGSGSFAIPAAVFPGAGSYTITINNIISLSSGCSNFNENVSATFEILAIPNPTGAAVAADDTCLGGSNEVFITGAASLPDGNYTINYQLSGANTAAGTVTVTFTGGNASFIIPASELTNPGDVTLTITQITLGGSTCGVNGNSFNIVTFNIAQLGIPVLVPSGEEFCAADNPTIADLSDNIGGTDPVTWYDADTGGNAYNDTDLLVNGQIYYATYTTASGCESPVRLAVTVDLTVCDDILIPDGFSPNGDNINDTFEIVNIRVLYPNFKLEIYNRYGSILYKGNTNTPDWDGTSKEGGVKLGNDVVPTGVYFYVLEFNDGSRKPVQGRVYLSR